MLLFFPRAVLAASLLALLCACGQKGPLYKPGIDPLEAAEAAKQRGETTTRRDSSPPDDPPTELGPLGDPTQAP
jgi:predicted small lipoprotein YifL